jgi:hypothetical protein
MGKHNKDARKGTLLLWIVQGLLGLLFLFAGGMKLVMPIEELAQQTQLPGLFMQFIGVAEVLGALGLILPGLFRVQLFLTPLAAAGLAIIMIGATVVTVVSIGIAPALMPLTVGVLATSVAYSRWARLPHRTVPRASVLQPAN